jgi:DNA-nicking Smr family endonuclease
MDFGDLLDEWERRSALPGGLDAARDAEEEIRGREAERRAKLDAEASARKKRDASHQSLESWLDAHGVEDKDRIGAGPGGIEERGIEAREADRRRLASLRPEAVLDLHGKSAAEAEASLALFLEDAGRSGIEKVLIITGKGNHSTEGPVLGRVVRAFLEASPRAGRFGQASRADGGTGALWVLIRRGSISRDR